MGVNVFAGQKVKFAHFAMYHSTSEVATECVELEPAAASSSSSASGEAVDQSA